MIVKAFITYWDAPDGPIAYFANLSSLSNLRSSFYALQTLLGDFGLVRRYCYYHSRFDVHDTISQIYQCSVVWQHNIWIIILLILFWISCAGKQIILWICYKGWWTCSKLVTGVCSLISHSKVLYEAQVFSIVKWVAVSFTTTLSTNVICTCTSSYWNPISYIDFMYSALIAFCIWSVDWAGEKYCETESTLKPVLAIVIKSGAIYSVSLIILLIIFFSHSWAYFILPQAVSSFHNVTNHSSSWTWIDNPNHCEIVHAFTYSIILLTWCVGLVFSMIFVWVGLSLAWQNGGQNHSFLTTLCYNWQLAAPAQPQSHFLQSIRVNISISTIDESQSTGIIGTQSNYKNNFL